MPPTCPPSTPCGFVLLTSGRAACGSNCISRPIDMDRSGCYYLPDMYKITHKEIRTKCSLSNQRQQNQEVSRALI